MEKIILIVLAILKAIEKISLEIASGKMFCWKRSGQYGFSKRQQRHTHTHTNIYTHTPHTHWEILNPHI